MPSSSLADAAPAAGRRPRRRWSWSVACLAALRAVAPAGAQAPLIAVRAAEADAAPAPRAATELEVAPSGARLRDSVSPRPDTARRRLPRWLALNGYVTQAGAVSRGGTMAGVPSGGTVDYRRVALLARAEPTPADRFVFQLADRRVGESPTAHYGRELKVDWLFYEHAFGDATRVRAGRGPLPFGIYNETRYVGTLLPFYQAPTSVYREKEFSAEAADGALAAHEFALPGGFGAELSAYTGRLDYVEASSAPYIPSTAAPAPGAPGAAAPPPNGWVYASARAHARGVLGSQLWLTTPIPGLRAGVGTFGTKLSGGIYRPAGRVDRARVTTGSLDGSFERFTARAELLTARIGALQTTGGYVQLGARVAGPLALYVQRDYSHVRLSDVPLPPTYAFQTLSFVQNRDHAASAVWTVRPGVQLRGEVHRTLGYNADEAIPLDGPAHRGRHAIVSLSTAF